MATAVRPALGSAFLLLAGAVGCGGRTQNAESGGGAVDGGSDDAADSGAVADAPATLVDCGPLSGLTVLATDPPATGTLAVDGTGVYWNGQIESNSGLLMKVPLCGGAATRLASVEYALGGSIALDPTHVYWSRVDSKNQTVDILRVPRAGGGTFDTLATSPSTWSGLAVNAAGVYWASSIDDALLTVPLDGGSVTTLASGAPLAVALDANSVYWTSGPFVFSVSLGGGAAKRLAVDTANPGGGGAIAVDGTSVYWTSGGSVEKVPIGGGATVTLAKSAASQGIAVDAENVYWTDSIDGTVVKMPVAGGAATTLAGGQYNPQGIALDATSVYWIDARACSLGPCGGRVMRLTPK